MKQRILVVDDEPAVLELIQTWLKPLPYEVLALADSREAAARLEREQFDSILMDVQMPHLDGFDLTRRVRNSPLNRQVPIVMITGCDDAETVQKGFKAGASFFVGKPITRQKLDGILRFAFAAKQLPPPSPPLPPCSARPAAERSRAVRRQAAPARASQARRAGTSPASRGSVAAPAAAGSARAARNARIVGALTLVLCVLAYATGDAVRGPFGKMLGRTGESFLVRTGEEVPVPLAGLKEGMDLSPHLALLDDTVEIWVRRTWLSGWSYRIGLKSADGDRVVSLSQDSVYQLPTGWDANADDSTVELVDQNGLPRLQVVQSRNYDIHVSGIFFNQNRAMLMKDGHLELKPAIEVTTEDYPRRIFKYPSYLHRGERER